MSVRIAVVGARGFIGSAIARRARADGHEVMECRHDALPEGNLGIVLYCSGVAWGADRDPIAAYRRHVADLLPLLEPARSERLVYLSSTRVYDHASKTSEATPPALRSDDPADTYALSKLAGEGLVLSAGPQHRVVRCSNVYGESFRSELFLSDILRQAATTGRIAIRTALDSSKDYVSVDDVAEAVLAIAAGSEHRIYNVAAGRNTTHGALLAAIARAVPFELSVAPDAPTVVAPLIDAGRLQSEFPFEPRDVLEDVGGLARAFCRKG